MTVKPGNVSHFLPANKLQPPHIDQTRSIRRHHLITEQLPPRLTAQTFIIIEAQAGQGKTTLARQYLAYTNTPFIWYQIGREDKEPAVLPAALFLAVSRLIPGGLSEHLITVSTTTSFRSIDLQQQINALLHEITGALAGDLFLVFDDLHLLNFAPATRELLDYLLETAPARLHFILTSRNPLHLNARPLRTSPNLLYLDNDDLALLPEEIESLYEHVWHTPISRSQAQEICARTNGWIMGVFLSARPLADGTDRYRSWLSTLRHTDPLPCFFDAEVLSQVPHRLKDTLIKISFLEEIDRELAIELSGVADLDRFLADLADRNHFIYPLDEDQATYRFHHLFQEYLQHIGRNQLSAHVITTLYRRAANFYLKRGMIDKALKIMRTSGDYCAMEQVVRHHGPRLVANNQSLAVFSLLQDIPHQDLLSHPWLCLYFGLLCADIAPQQSLQFFDSCKACFVDAADQQGELLTLSQLIHYHVVISGDFRAGGKLLKRAQELFEQTLAQLAVEETVLIARNLAAGFFHFTGDTDRARYYAQLSYSCAAAHGSKNLIAAARFIVGYISLLCGDRRVARRETEASYLLTGDSQVGAGNRMALHLMQLCKLSMHGEHPAFFQHRDLVQRELDPLLLSQTIAASYLDLWSAIAALAEGDTTTALEQLECGISRRQTITNHHLLSQYHQWKAFIAALLSDGEAASRSLTAASSLRTSTGGPLHGARQQAMAGATLVIIGRLQEAKPLLHHARQIAERIEAVAVTVCCLAYQTIIALAENDENAVGRLLQDLFTLMNRFGYTYFWGWEPTTMARLLCAAVRMDVAPGFARRLAEKRLASFIDDHGMLRPLLIINLLGSFSITSNNERSISAGDLSRQQRELIGLLAASPGQRLAQEQAQLALWPDSPPDKARKSFDTLMARLRRVLTEKLGIPAKHYLRVERGYVQFRHVSIDAISFLHHARHGLKLTDQGLWWQADVAFAKALSLWATLQPAISFTDDQTVHFFEDIVTVGHRVCLTWGATLSTLNRTEEALALLEKAGRLQPADEDAARLRYQLCLTIGKPLKAREVLAEYRRELVRLGFQDTEITEMTTALTASCLPVAGPAGNEMGIHLTR